MANYRPLIVNSSAQQIQEITDSDSLIGNGTIQLVVSSYGLERQFHQGGHYVMVRIAHQT